jgi:cellulose synthase/poly-beta-1,6-N-acetylglucosamine synthase-like glycosyltransferase
MEILPGVVTWITLLGAVIFSWFVPFWVAVFIIFFDIYWVLKAVNTAMHLLSSFLTLKLHATYDWRMRLELLKVPLQYKQYLREEIGKSFSRRQKRDLLRELQKFEKLDFGGRLLDWKQVYHLVLLPTYKESVEVLDNSIRSVLEADFPTEQIFFVLATEERDYERALAGSEILRKRYQNAFFRFEVIMHPDGLAGEIKAKGANLTYAARKAVEILKNLNIPLEHILVSAFDADTVVSKNYFSYLTYAFLTAEKPYRTSYQPMPVYNNNIWDAPAITRVIAVANSFWQMVEASRPDRLVTFSSHAMTLKALAEVDFWPVDAISDDSQIFWRCWLSYHGDYRTQPIFTTISLDAMLDETYWKTLLGQYKQKRRWAWGIENFPYLVTNAARDKLIPFWKKLLYIERMLEGFYFWATASLMIVGLGWLPLLLGGARFEEGVFALNLPFLTRTIMQIATIFLIFSVYINMVLIPPRPPRCSKWKTVNMILQWIFVPIVSTVFGSAPAIDAQTRLMFGKYMEFWVTPKARRSQHEHH